MMFLNFSKLFQNNFQLRILHLVKILINHVARIKIFFREGGTQNIYLSHTNQGTTRTVLPRYERVNQERGKYTKQK